MQLVLEELLPQTWQQGQNMQWGLFELSEAIGCSRYRHFRASFWDGGLGGLYGQQVTGVIGVSAALGQFCTEILGSMLIFLHSVKSK